MQLLQCCPVCRESCGENDLRKNIILQQLTDHLELLPARICARLAHPSGDKSAAENLRRKDPTFKAAGTIAKHISGGARACCMAANKCMLATLLHTRITQACRKGMHTSVCAHAQMCAHILRAHAGACTRCGRSP